MRKKSMLFLWKRDNPPKDQSPRQQAATANLPTVLWSLRGVMYQPISTITQHRHPPGRTTLRPRGPSWTVAGSWNKSATTANAPAPGRRTQRRTTRGGHTMSWNARGGMSWKGVFLPSATRSPNWKTTRRPPKWSSSKKPPPTSSRSRSKSRSSFPRRTCWGSGGNSWNTNSNNFGTRVHEVWAVGGRNWNAGELSLVPQGKGSFWQNWLPDLLRTDSENAWWIVQPHNRGWVLRTARFSHNVNCLKWDFGHKRTFFYACFLFFFPLNRFVFKNSF